MSTIHSGFEDSPRVYQEAETTSRPGNSSAAAEKHAHTQREISKKYISNLADDKLQLTISTFCMFVQGLYNNNTYLCDPNRVLKLPQTYAVCHL